MCSEKKGTESHDAKKLRRVEKRETKAFSEIAGRERREKLKRLGGLEKKGGT